MNLSDISIPPEEQQSILSSFWCLLRECEEVAYSNNDTLLKMQVEGAYKVLNRVTGLSQLPRWLEE